MLETLFNAKETTSTLDGKSTRHLMIDQVDIDRPIVRKDKMKEAPFA